jgi:hypothetical protein
MRLINNLKDLTPLDEVNKYKLHKRGAVWIEQFHILSVSGEIAPGLEDPQFPSWSGTGLYGVPC